MILAENFYLLKINIQIMVRFFVDHRIKQHTSLLMSETV